MMMTATDTDDDVYFCLIFIFIYYSSWIYFAVPCDAIVVVLLIYYAPPLAKRRGEDFELLHLSNYKGF